VTRPRVWAHSVTAPARKTRHETRADRTDPAKPRLEVRKNDNWVPGTRFASGRRSDQPSARLTAAAASTAVSAAVSMETNSLIPSPARKILSASPRSRAA
jgi:hypothetical protein